MPTTVADIRAKISVDGAGKAQSDLKGVNDEVDSSTKKWKAAGDVASKAGGALTLGLTAPIVGFGVASLMASTNFNTAMANVASLLPGNIDRVNQLKQNVQDMSVQFGTSTDDLSAGLYQLLSAFGDDADTAKRLAIETEAAKAGVASVSDAINLTSAVTKAYGDTSANAVQHVSDLALLTVKLGQTTFPELASSIGQVTALSSNLNISQAQLFATFASTSGVIGTSAQVATDMKGAMQALLAPTSSMSDLFKKVGVNSGQALIQQYGFAGAMQKIVDYAKQTHQPLQSLIGSIEGQTLALSLAGPQGKAYNDALGQMNKAAGTTDQAFKDQTQGVNKAGFAWSQLTAQGQVFLQQAGDALAPVLLQILGVVQPMLPAIGSLVSSFASWSPVLKTIVVAGAGLLAALGPVLLIVGQLVTAVLAILPVLAPVGAAIAAIGAGPIVLIVAGIAALIAGIVLLIQHWQQISSAIGGNPIFQGLVKVFQDLGSTIASQVQPILTQLQTTLRTQLLPAWQGIQQAFNTIKPVLIVVGAIIGTVLLVALGLLVGVLKGVFSALGPILSGVIAVFGGIAQVISGVVQVIVGIFQVLVGLVKGIFTGDWTTLGDGLNNLKNGVLNILGGLWSAVVGIFQGLVDGVVGLVSGLVSGVIGFFQNLWEKIVGHSIVPDLVNGVLSWISNLVGTFLGFIGGLVSQVISFFLNLGIRVLSAVNAFVGLVLSTVDSWRDAFVARIKAMIALAQSIFHGIIEVITSPFTTAKNTVLGIINDIKGFFSGLHLSFPQLHMPPLPHFSLTGDFSLNPPSVPHLDVKWYATGGIAGLHGPELIGVGERGPEAVVPLSALNNGGSAGGLSSQREVTLNLNLIVNGRQLATAVGPEMVNELKRYGIRIG